MKGCPRNTYFKDAVKGKSLPLTDCIHKHVKHNSPDRKFEETIISTVCN